MTDKMTKSEVMKKLRTMVDRQSDGLCVYGPFYWSDVVCDLLDAEDDPHDAHYEATVIPAPDYDPDDVAFKRLPRLVEITDWQGPTLGQFDGKGPQRCEQHGDVVMRMNVGGEVFRVKPDGSQGTPVKKYTPNAYRVLDADPIRPKRVGELTDGMIAVVNGRLSICTKQFALVDIEDGGHHAPTADTPITGPVYRIETNPQQGTTQ